MDIVNQLADTISSYGFIDLEGLERVREHMSTPPATFYGAILRGIADGTMEVLYGSDFDQDAIDNGEVDEDEVYISVL
jgi:hypothetical protein